MAWVGVYGPYNEYAPGELDQALALHTPWEQAFTSPFAMGQEYMPNGLFWPVRVEDESESFETDGVTLADNGPLTNPLPSITNQERLVTATPEAWGEGAGFLCRASDQVRQHPILAIGALVLAYSLIHKGRGR